MNTKPTPPLVLLALLLAACAPSGASEDLDAAREREADRISAEVEAAATEPVTPVDEVDAQMLAVQDARDEMNDRHTDELRDLEQRQDDILRDAEDECMQPLTDTAIDNGLLPPGTKWHEYSGDVFPGIGGEMGLDLTQDEIDLLADRANGKCLHVGDDTYGEQMDELTDRQDREMRALDAEEQAIWDQQIEDGTYSP